MSAISNTYSCLYVTLNNSVLAGFVSSRCRLFGRHSAINIEGVARVTVIILQPLLQNKSGPAAKTSYILFLSKQTFVSGWRVLCTTCPYSAGSTVALFGSWGFMNSGAATIQIGRESATLESFGLGSLYVIHFPRFFAPYTYHCLSMRCECAPGTGRSYIASPGGRALLSPTPQLALFLSLTKN